MKLKMKLLPLTSLALIGTAIVPFATSCGPTDNKTKVVVTIDLDGGTLAGQTGTITKEVEKGSLYSSLGTPTKTDFDFKGWLKNGSIVDSKATIESDVSIKASWTPDTPPVADCNVTMDLDGGILDGETGTIIKQVPKGTKYSSLGTPTRINFDFQYWEKDDGTHIEDGDTIDGDVNIKAIWEESPKPVITKKTAKFYEFGNDAEGYLSYVESGYTLDVYMINDSQVPYVSVDDMLYEALWNYGLTRTGNKFVATNNWTSSAGNVTCTFDIDAQTITFSDYDKFVFDYAHYYYYDDCVNNPLASGSCGGLEGYKKSRVDGYISGGNYTIDLSKYSIPIYCDQNGAYIPYHLSYDLFGWDLSKGAGSYTGSFFFIRNNFYEVWNDDDAATTTISYAYYMYAGIARSFEGIPSGEPIFNTQYRQFCYNLLALTLDTRFGMTTRPSRSNPGTTIEYFPNGAYELISPYYEDFISNSIDVSNNAIINIVKNFCDDGGHAGYYGCDVTGKTPSWFGLDDLGPESLHTQYAFYWMGQARYDAGHDFTGDSNITIESSTDGADDIAWVTFDQFKSATPTYNQITKDNYMDYGTVGMTMYLQKLVNASDSKIKKIVIDLANNGGGAVYTEHFLASYLCGRDNLCEPHDSSLGHGGVTHTIWNPHSKAFSKYTYYADIDGDGDYDQDDYLPADVQVYCIVSDGSFSCGNMLPSHLADCSNCKFIGSKSGGGACYVDSNMEIGLGNVFTSSSNFHSLKYASTPSNPITVDEGVEGTYYHINCNQTEASHFFNREEIITYINNNP